MTEDFPQELTGTIQNFHKELENLEESLDLLFSKPRSDLTEGLDSLGKAKFDLISAFGLNSLVWMLLRTQGENPKETEVKGEMDRVRTAMARAKEIQDRSLRVRVDRAAAKRFVKSGLWQAKDKEQKE